MSVRPPGGPPARWLFVSGFLALGVFVFGPLLGSVPRYQTWDWGPHHALTRALARALAAGHVPSYSTGVATGAAPFDTYPLPAYALAAGLSLLAGGEAEAPRVLWLLGVLCHVGIAALIARLASRFAPPALAVAVGIAALFDAGSFGSGAGNTVLEIGLLHNSLALALGLLALDQVVTLLERGTRPATVVGLWCCAGLAAASHPAGLLFLAPLPVVLLLPLCAARDAVPRRAAAAALHVVIGLLLAAGSWAPLMARTLRYGPHLATPPPSVSEALLGFASLAQPPTSWPLLLAFGYLGLLAALVQRRAAALLLAGHTLLLLAASTNIPYRLLFDAFPSTLVRWQGFRFVTLSRPLLFVAAAALLALGWDKLRRVRLTGYLLPAGALALLAGGVLATANPEFPGGLGRLRSLASAGVPDHEGFAALLEWARGERARAPQQTVARFLWEDPENAGYHVTAETGWPAFSTADSLGMLLREQIEDRSPQSLRRFNARWVVFRNSSAWPGEPPGERRFGSYRVRELPLWDGRLARVEAGGGEAHVTSIADERIEVELRETDAPALVALGIGHYPRWRARRPDGTPIPVYAFPSRPEGVARVVAAWIPPGKTIFSADEALPSDGRGRRVSLLAAGMAALALVVPRLPWIRVRRTRARLLRLISARRVRAFGLLAFALGAATLLALSARPVTDVTLRLVPGWWPEADVSARAPEGEWTRCAFSYVRRDFECPGLGRIGDGVAFTLGDHPASTPFLTPAIVARPAERRVEYRVRLARRLRGSHWAATWGPGGATLTCGGRELSLAARKHSFELGGGPTTTECELLLRTRGRATQGATVVRPDVLDFDRERDAPWAPAAPPPPR